MTEFRLQKVSFYSAVFLLLFIAYCKVSWCTSQVTQPDQGLFATFGYLLTQGKTLYIDFFDHKPPAIFILNALFIKLGGPNENAISYGIVFFALIQTLVMFFIIRKLSKNDWVAISGTLAFILVFFDFNLFGSGNFTEQYGTLCSTAAFLAFLWACEKPNYRQYFISGILYAMAFWFKEPFLLSAIPVGLWLLIRTFRNSAEWKNLAAFVLAWPIISVLFLLWMYMNGSILGYIEHLSHSFEYTGHGNSLWTKVSKNYHNLFHYMHLTTPRTLIVLGVSFVILVIKAIKQPVNWILAGSIVTEYIATGLSGNDFHHYFLQYIPIFIIVVSTSLGAINKVRKIELSPWLRSLPVFAWFTVMLILAKPWHNLRLSPEKRNWDEVAEYLEKNEPNVPRNIALGSQELGFCLLKNKGQSSMRYVVPYPFHWVIRDEAKKNQFLKQEYNRFVNHPPDYIIYNGGFSQLWVDAGIDTLAIAGYKEVTGNHLDHLQVILLKRKK